MRNKSLPFQARIVILALLGGLPALIVAFSLMGDMDVLPSIRRLIVIVLLG